MPSFFKKTPVQVGTPVYLDTQRVNAPITVTALPGAGGTMAVAYSTSPEAMSDPNSATWFNWPSGAVAVNTCDAITVPVRALRFTAATQAGNVEVVA